MADATPIYVYWVRCPMCGYETVAHGRVDCPDCGDRLTSEAVAGAVVDDRQTAE